MILHFTGIGYIGAEPQLKSKQATAFYDSHALG